MLTIRFLIRLTAVSRFNTLRSCAFSMLSRLFSSSSAFILCFMFRARYTNCLRLFQIADFAKNVFFQVSTPKAIQLRISNAACGLTL